VPRLMKQLFPRSGQRDTARAGASAIPCQMGNQIVLAPEAEQDLNEIVAYIARDNPAAAEHLESDCLTEWSSFASFAVENSLRLSLRVTAINWRFLLGAFV
jgi:hypothetical protein